jgi:hypothetical protein
VLVLLLGLRHGVPPGCVVTGIHPAFLKKRGAMIGLRSPEVNPPNHEKRLKLFCNHLNERKNKKFTIKSILGIIPNIYEQ